MSLIVPSSSRGDTPAGTLEKPASGALTRYSYSQYHMGVDARLVFYARDRQSAETAGAAAFARIAALDTIMSDYQVRSELMRLCGRSGGRPIRVSPELYLVLRRAQEVSRLSDGAFDVTASPLIRLWRKARKSATLPTPTELSAARKLVGWRKMRLDPRKRTVHLTVKGMQLDLGGIAKGYAADEAQRVLKKHGVTRALVQLGGDIVVSGPPPETEGWTLRVPYAGEGSPPPSPATEGAPAGVDMKFKECAVSTSGDTEQSTVIEGKRYSHVVDPRTGVALTNRVQVSLIAPDGLTSDPLSTTLSLVGEKEREAILKAYPGTKAYVRVLSLGDAAH